MTQFFDFNDIENPVKYHFDDNNVLILNSQSYEVQYLLARKNEYVLNDNKFGLSGSESGIFYSLKRGAQMTFIQEYTNILGLVIIKLDDQIDRYERSLPTVIEAFGVIGGIYEIFKVLFRLLIGIYTTRRFSNEVSNI